MISRRNMFNSFFLNSVYCIHTVFCLECAEGWAYCLQLDSFLYFFQVCHQSFDMFRPISDELCFLANEIEVCSLLTSNSFWKFPRKPNVFLIKLLQKLCVRVLKMFDVFYFDWSMEFDSSKSLDCSVRMLRMCTELLCVLSIETHEV